MGERMSAEPQHRKRGFKRSSSLEVSEREKQWELSYHKAGRCDLTLLPSVPVS